MELLLAVIVPSVQSSRPSYFNHLHVVVLRTLTSCITPAKFRRLSTVQIDGLFIKSELLHMTCANLAGTTKKENLLLSGEIDGLGSVEIDMTRGKASLNS